MDFIEHCKCSSKHCDSKISSHIEPFDTDLTIYILYIFIQSLRATRSVLFLNTETKIKLNSI